MSGETIPLELRRFILTSIDSVPHLEILLLLHRAPHMKWNVQIVTQGLFINEQKVEKALCDLSRSGFVIAMNEAGTYYRYCPVTAKLKDMVDLLAKLYPKNIIEITHLIHSKINKQAQQFGDAFKWKSEKE